MYYVFVSICAILILGEIIVADLRRNNLVFINLAKTIALGLNISLSNQIVFPRGIGGVDSYYHIYNLILPIFETGSIPLNTMYTYFPGHHILVVAVAALMDVDPQLAYYWLGGVIMTLCVLFVFIMGRLIFGIHVGLLSALVFPFCGFVLFWASHPAQLAFAFPLVILIFVIILYRYITNNFRHSILLEVLIIAVIFTHHYTSAVFLIIFVAFIIANKLTNSNYQSSAVLLMYFSAVIAQWIYYSGFYDKVVDIVASYIEIIKTFGITQPMRYDVLPLDIIFLNTFGTSILLSLSAFSFFYLLKNKNFITKVICISSVVILFMMGAGIVFKEAYYLLPQRLFVFLHGFGLVFFSGVTLAGVIYSNSKVGKILCIFVIFLYVFFSVASTISGFETSLFLGDQPFRKLYMTPHELSSEDWLEAHVGCGNFTFYKSGSFYDFVSPAAKIPSKIPYTRIPIVGNSVDMYNLTSSSYILFSKFDIYDGFLLRYQIGRMGTGEIIKLDRNSYILLSTKNKYYENGIVSIFYVE